MQMTNSLIHIHYCILLKVCDTHSFLLLEKKKHFLYYFLIN